MNPLVTTILQRAKRNPNSTALISGECRVSYQSLAERIQTMIDRLNKLKATRIGLYMDNCAEWVEIDLAAFALGLTIVPLPLNFSEQQLTHAITRGELDGVFINQTNIPESLDDLFQETVELGASLSFRRTRSADKPESNRQASSIKVTFTSGSTGAPEGVSLAENTLIDVTNSLSTILQQSQVKSHLCLLPLSTLLENIAGIYAHLALGNCIRLAPPETLGFHSNHHFDPHSLLNFLSCAPVDSVVLMPHMLKSLLQIPDINLLKRMKFIAVGGGKLSEDLVHDAASKNLPVYEGYGLSECGSVVSLNTPDACRIGSVGRPLPHVDVFIARDGEIIVSNKSTVREKRVTDIHTGDIGHFDSGGFLHVTGRKKNVLISSFGRNISPEWVESCLLTSPIIDQCLVAGDGETHLSAILVPTSSSNLEQLQTAIDKTNRALPDYARVLHWIIAEEDFNQQNQELTSNGKLRRTAILQRYSERLFLKNKKVSKA